MSNLLKEYWEIRFENKIPSVGWKRYYELKELLEQVIKKEYEKL